MPCTHNTRAHGSKKGRHKSGSRSRQLGGSSAPRHRVESSASGSAAALLASHARRHDGPRPDGPTATPEPGSAEGVGCGISAGRVPRVPGTCRVRGWPARAPRPWAMGVGRGPWGRRAPGRGPRAPRGVHTMWHVRFEKTSAEINPRTPMSICAQKGDRHASDSHGHARRFDTGNRLTRGVTRQLARHTPAPNICTLFHRPHAVRRSAQSPTHSTSVHARYSPSLLGVSGGSRPTASGAGRRQAVHVTHEKGARRAKQISRRPNRRSDRSSACAYQ